MTRIVFTSNLSSRYKRHLEELLFFNPGQERVRAKLIGINSRYGAPRIEALDGRLSVVLESSRPPQTLFVVEGGDGQESLIGAMVYLREDATLSLLHVAVREDWTGIRSDGGAPIVLSMADQLRDIARRVKGIRSITVFPGTARENIVPIRGQRNCELLSADHPHAQGAAQ